MEFKKAVKSKCKARVAIYGPSGGGKTMSALRIAKGLGGKVAVIDSERGSASKYADRFEFDALELEQPNIDSMVQGIKAAHGYGVLIIDSLSHSWQELLQEIDKLANAKFKGNTWSAWSEGTPKQRRLIDAILTFPGHVIATMRSKTEWTQEASSNGKSRPVRVGLAPEQGKGIEYEFDILMAITPEHTAHVEKDRSGMFQDAIIDKPDEAFGEKLAAWLSDAPAPDRVEAEEVFIDECLRDINDAADLKSLQAIGSILPGKSSRVRDAVREAYSAKAKTFKPQQA
jgi:hypothetical protein